MKDDELKKYLLAQLTQDQLSDLVKGIVVDAMDEPVSLELNGKLSAMQKFYAKRKIPGSTSKCTRCGQSLVNNEAHAIELLGGENIELE